ncbi:MAG: hypothetical protein BMS9Abin37_2050 [Acidobacteriota bacterium]|nr:MAG: hypothetical protein BMS9Abin37_2050 [Acidobacteriota bacterium]
MSAPKLERECCITGCGRERVHWVESGELPLIVGYCDECVQRCDVTDCAQPVGAFGSNGRESFCRYHAGDLRAALRAVETMRKGVKNHGLD